MPVLFCQYKGSRAKALTLHESVLIFISPEKPVSSRHSIRLPLGRVRGTNTLSLPLKRQGIAIPLPFSFSLFLLSFILLSSWSNCRIEPLKTSSPIIGPKTLEPSLLPPSSTATLKSCKWTSPQVKSWSSNSCQCIIESCAFCIGIFGSKSVLSWYCLPATTVISAPVSSIPWSVSPSATKVTP